MTDRGTGRLTKPLNHQSKPAAGGNTFKFQRLFPNRTCPRSGGHQQAAHHINFEIVYAAIKRWGHLHSDAAILPAS